MSAASDRKAELVRAAFREELDLLAAQSAEARRLREELTRVGRERAATVKRLHAQRVPYHLLASTMGTSNACVQGLLRREVAPSDE